MAEIEVAAPIDHRARALRVPELSTASDASRQ